MTAKSSLFILLCCQMASYLEKVCPKMPEGSGYMPQHAQEKRGYMPNRGYMPKHAQLEGVCPNMSKRGTCPNMPDREGTCSNMLNGRGYMPKHAQGEGYMHKHALQGGYMPKHTRRGGTCPNMPEGRGVHAQTCPTGGVRA